MRDLSRSPNKLYLATYILNESWTRTFVYSSKFSNNYILSHIYGSSPSLVMDLNSFWNTLIVITCDNI